MWKKRHIDFILNEDEYGRETRLVFRFYPRTSSCHSFNNNPPKTWKDVYKVYYHWAILSQRKEKGTWHTEIVYEEHCDECSVLDDIAYICKKLHDGIYVETDTVNGELHTFEYLNKEILPFGMATSWQIQKKESKIYFVQTDNGLLEYDEEDAPIKIDFTFMLFGWFNNGYRFTLPQSKLLEFSEFLTECCEYMLTHGDPI